MSQNQGWIKQHRSMTHKFSDNKKLNSELWLLYHYVVQQVAYDDMINVKKGQVQISAPEIQRDFLPQFNHVKLSRMLNKLAKDGYIILTPMKNTKAGYLLEICHYDQFFGKNDQNECNASVMQVLRKCNGENISNNLESLQNNCAENEQCNASVMQVLRKCNGDECSLLEERKKKKEEEEYFSDESLKASASDAQISDDMSLVPTKEKKPRAKKEVKKTPTKKAVNAALNKARYSVYRIFAPDSRYVTGSTYCDKSAIFFTVNELVEKYGEQIVIQAIAEMYAEFKANDLIGKKSYNIALVEACLNDAIAIFVDKKDGSEMQMIDEIPF